MIYLFADIIHIIACIKIVNSSFTIRDEKFWICRWRRI